MLHALLFAALPHAMPAPLKADLRHFRKGRCAQAVRFADFVTCGGEETRDYIGRVIVEEDESPIHVIDAACDAPWHVTFLPTHERGGFLYDRVTVRNDVAAVPFEITPKRTIYVHYRLRGLKATYVGYSSRL